MPAETLKKCDPPYEAEDGRVSTLLRNHVEVRGQYEECATRHNALVDRIKEINEEIGE